jgi:transposase
MTDTAWIGIDVAKETFDAAIDIGGGAVSPLTPAPFERSPRGVEQMLAWIDDVLGDRAPDARAVMEATGRYSIELSAWITQARPAMMPAIVNPELVWAFARSLGLRGKTDAIDARALARYGRERTPLPHEPLGPAHARLRDLTRERQALVESLVAHRQRAGEPCQSDLVVEVQRQVIGSLRDAIGQIERAIDAVISEDSDLARDVALLESIPGVGRLTTAVILGEIGDLRRFERARQLSAFVGVSPREHTSGTSVRRRTRLCKKGNAQARRALYMAAVSASRGDRHHLARFHRALVEDRGLAKKASLGALMRKLLVLMRALLISGEAYRDDYPRQDHRIAA